MTIEIEPDERRAALLSMTMTAEYTPPEKSVGIQEGYTFSVSPQEYTTIRAALQSPRVPVIEGLDEANKMFHDIEQVAEKYGKVAKEDPATQALLKIHKAARAYAELQKGV